MNRIKALLVVMLSIVALSGHGQFRDTVDTVLPALDYETPRKYNIKDIKVTGVNHISPELIINACGLHRGDSLYLPGDYISNALQLLWSQRYYSNVRAIVQIEGDDIYLEIALKERPRVSVWNIEGVKNGEKSEILKRLKLKERTELSDYALKNSTDIIRRYLAEKGYLNAEIAVRQENDSLLDNFVIVTFDIDKKSKVKIGEVRIEGAENIPEKKLKTAMKKTREKSLVNLFKSAKFNRSEYEDNSKRELIDYMQGRGYRDAAIVSDTIYDINDKRIGIKLKVDEGKKYYYRNISWVGNTKYTNEYLDMLLGVKKGDVYDKKNMESRLGLGIDGSKAVMSGATTVSSIYQNDGHLTFSLEPVETVVAGDSIDIELRMVEGKQFTVNDVIIAGNNRTNDRVVRRELYVRPGELYDQSMLINTLNVIGSLNHFNPEAIVPDIIPVSDELVDIRFDLEEQHSDEFEISGGWGGGMFVASVGVSFNNVSMRKFFDRHAWRPYPSGDNQQLRFNVQSNGVYYQAVSVSFVEPWLGGKKPNPFSVSVYFSSESDATYFNKHSNNRFRTIGASVGLGKRLAWPDPYFQIMGELSYQAYKMKDWSYFLFRNGIANTIAISGTLSRNSTDQIVYPRRGSEVSMKLTMTPPYSLFDKNKKDYSESNTDMSDQERYRWIEYYKVNGMARFFVPMLNNNKLVFMAKAEFGYLGHYNPNKISPFEGFSMGGDGVTGYNLYGIESIGLRGYDENSLTPYAHSGKQARVYAKYTAELRYPIVLQPSSTVYGLIFAEAGNAFDRWRDFNPFDVKRSLGVGVRLNLPMLGMFGVEWGYGFDRIPSTNQRGGSQIHFSLGQTF